MRPGYLMTVILASAFASGAPAQEVDSKKVHVVNFPETQSIQGVVEIDGPTTNTTLTSISETVVAPVEPYETAKLVRAGTLDASGFRTAVLSLVGQIKSNYLAEGTVGAILVPDTQFIGRAFQEDGETLLSVRIEAAVQEETGSYFAVTHPPLDLAFPGYKVYFFNTTELPSSAILYAHLAN